MGAIHNDRRQQSGRGWSNGDQSESIVYVSGLLTLRSSKPDYTSDTHLSLFEMQSGHTSGPQRRETNRTKGAGSPFGEQARGRLRRTENLPGGRPGIPRHNAVAFGGGRMSRWIWSKDWLNAPQARQAYFPWLWRCLCRKK